METFNKNAMEDTKQSIARLNSDKYILNDKLIEDENQFGINGKNLSHNSGYFKSLLSSRKNSTFKCFKSIFCCFRKKQSQKSPIASLQRMQSSRSTVFQRKKSILKEVIELKKMNEWDQFKEALNPDDKNKTLTSRFFAIFKDDSSYLRIWNLFFSLFVVFVVYLYFFKCFFVDLHLDLEQNLSAFFEYTYYFINLVFAIDCINSIMRLFTSITLMDRYTNILLVIPLKILMSIPFSLKNANIILISFKFFRIDLIHTLFQVVKIKSDNIIKQYIHDIKLKIYLVFFNSIFKFLLIFILYAHFIACLNVIIISELKEKQSMYDTNINIYHYASYLEFLYFSFTIFTTVGYGDIIPYNIVSMLIVMINMIFGVELFGIILYYIQLLFAQLKNFKNEELLQNFDNFISKIEKNSGKILPKFLRDAIYACYSLKMGISFHKLFTTYGSLFKSCSKDLSDNLKDNIFEFIDSEYSVFFKGCSKEFKYEMFSHLKPKIFNPGKTLLEIGKNTKKIYFLLYGGVSVYNEFGSIFLLYPTSALVGDWPFVTNTRSEFSYKVNENKFAVGFVLDIKSFKEISERNILSSQEFFKISHRKIEFMKRMNNSFKFCNPLIEKDDESINGENKRNTISKFSNVAKKTNTDNANSNNFQRSHNKTVIKHKKESITHEIKKKISDYKTKIIEFEFSLNNLENNIKETMKDTNQIILHKINNRKNNLKTI